MSKIGDLTKRLFPSGYAHRTIKDGIKDKWIEGLALSEQQVYDDADSVLNSMLPDNASFTADDATRLEHMLGMITNPSVSLQDRKDAIIRKLNHPGDIPARQSGDYLQDQLQLAGFNVYVYDTTWSIEQLLNAAGWTGDSLQFGDIEFGDGEWGQIMYDDKIVNSLDGYVDKFFLEDSQNRNTFVICGSTLGTPATVDVNRRDEFRQTILRIKPAQTVGYLLINYV